MDNQLDLGVQAAMRTPVAPLAAVCAGVHPMLFAPFDDAGRLDRGIAELMTDAAVLSGADGVSVLGEVTEASRLSAAERRLLVEWVASRLAGRVPLCISIDAPELRACIELARASRAAGAAWIMIQPPPLPGLSAAELLRYFAAIADAAELPVCVRNAPRVLGLGLGIDELVRLKQSCPNLVAVKVEADPIAIAHLVDALDGALDVVNGRGALEMTDCLRAGAVGVMPGLETVDVLCRVFHGMRRAEEAPAAEALFRSIAPLFTFLSLSTAHRLLYGKQLLAARLGVPALPPRPPFDPPHRFGSALIRRWAEELGPLPRHDRPGASR